jgi:hypothetical protein
MRTYVFEGVQDVGFPLNWGKFLVGVPDVEWSLRSDIDPENPRPLLAQIGWEPGEIWVCDLQTREGAFFWPGGNARADLERHRIWVCPLFEMFLTWLYQQNIEALHLLPRIVALPDAQFSINGYRRLGPHDVSFTLTKGDLLTIEWGDEPRTVICEDVTSEGALIRSLTAAEIAALEEMLRGQGEEEITTVTFTFPSGAKVAVAPDGTALVSPEVKEIDVHVPEDVADTATPEPPGSPDDTKTMEEPGGPADTEALDTAEPKTSDLPAVDLADTAADPPTRKTTKK